MPGSVGLHRARRRHRAVRPDHDVVGEGHAPLVLLEDALDERLPHDLVSRPNRSIRSTSAFSRSSSGRTSASRDEGAERERVALKTPSPRG